MRKRFRVLASLLSIYIVISCLVALFLVHVTLHPGRRPLPPAAEAHMSSIAAGFQAHLEDVRITAPDGTALRAWHVQREHNNGNAVILLHGLGDNRMGMIGYAELLL